MSISKVTLEVVNDNVAVITLDNQPIRNALDLSMVNGLYEAFNQIEADPNYDAVRCVVLTGAGKAFCGGLFLDPNLVDGSATNPEENISAELFWGLIPMIRNCRTPVIAAVRGPVAGAGTGLMMACDFAIADTTMKFTLSFIDRGLVPDVGVTWFLHERLGSAGALHLALTKDRILADEAQNLGLVQEVVDDGDLLDRATHLAAKVAGKQPLAVKKARTLIRGASNTTLSEQMDQEFAHQEELLETEDFREGVAAFLEKRRPVFKGK